MIKRIVRQLSLGTIVPRARRAMGLLLPSVGKPIDPVNLQQDETFFRISEGYKFFSEIKGKYAGQRAFVIGNGPSLRFDDLALLRNEVSIASNKIYLAYDKVDWRPTFLTVADPLVWQKVQNEVWRYHNQVLVPSYLPDFGLPPHKVITFRDLSNASDLWRNDQLNHFSDDFCNGAYGGYTVTYENLQLAVHLGCNPIYIIGCDHYYKGETEILPTGEIISIDTNNHFLPGYRVHGEVVNPAPIDQMNESYAQARFFSDLNNIRIINATRGGHLEVFERVCFEDLF